MGVVIFFAGAIAAYFAMRPEQGPKLAYVSPAQSKIDGDYAAAVNGA